MVGADGVPSTAPESPRDDANCADDPGWAPPFGCGGGVAGPEWNIAPKPPVGSGTGRVKRERATGAGGGGCGGGGGGAAARGRAAGGGVSWLSLIPVW